MKDTLDWMSSHSVALPIMVKVLKLGISSGKHVQKEDVLFDQWVFEVRNALQSHSEAILWEGIVHSLQGAPVSQIIENWTCVWHFHFI